MPSLHVQCSFSPKDDYIEHLVETSAKIASLELVYREPCMVFFCCCCTIFAHHAQSTYMYVHVIFISFTFRFLPPPLPFRAPPLLSSLLCQIAVPFPPSLPPLSPHIIFAPSLLGGSCVPLNSARCVRSVWAEFFPLIIATLPATVPCPNWLSGKSNICMPLH